MAAPSPSPLPRPAPRVPPTRGPRRRRLPGVTRKIHHVCPNSRVPETSPALVPLARLSSSTRLALDR